MRPSYRIFLALQLILLPIFVQAGDGEIPRLNLLHPQQNMQFWVDRIEVAGDIPQGTEVSVAGEIVVPDEDGRFRYMLTLDQPTVLIPIVETRGSRTFRDTIRVFHRNPDHLLSDSIFVNNNIPEILAINFVYPQSGDFYGSQIGLRGRTHPEATLLMNGDTVKVYASGAYTTHVQVQPGENYYDFKASLDGNAVTERLTLVRPVTESEPGKLVVSSAKPVQEQWLLAGEYLQVGIRGPSSRKVYFKIAGLTTWQILTELNPGHYTGSVHLLDIDKEVNTWVIYRMGPLSKRIKSAPLRIITDALGGLTSHSDTRVYDLPSTDQLLFPLADSVSLQIIGLENRMYRIRLGDYRTAYVRAIRVKLDPASKLTAAQLLGPMRSENLGDWTIFRINTGKQAPTF
ncbi:MAG: hypothetical protein L3J79_12530 [Candidatus Marinimicrobia bacterium]|nr:hypothetical protein [Candidatus Neomarinimicrobiota bacterium]